jgi:hypothetical protein
MGKNDVEKLTKWEQLKMKSKVKSKVDLEFDDGDIISIDIQSLSQATLDAINDKYDDMKEPRPLVKIPGVNKTMPAPEGSKEFMEWDKSNKAIDSLKVAETAIAFMVEKPTGNTVEEQIKELKEVVLPGHFIQIVKEGYKICGFKLDDETINTAKNF